MIRSPKKMHELCRALSRRGLKIGLVPTMGALHAGHLSLIRRARAENDRVVVSIFVNPMQFGRNEDLGRYPRTLREDSVLCRRNGVDFIFFPGVGQMYPPGFASCVQVEALSNVLCGLSRPGHFRGVATVVAKLFNIVRPDNAYFGQKDAQQARIIKRMNDDLDFGIKIHVMPIVREPDGLAMSSRNRYLTPEERRDALVLSQALRAAARMAEEGVADTARIIRRLKMIVGAKKRAHIDYISIVDEESLRPLSRIRGRALLAMAVWVGKTRLIDNAVLRVK